MIRVVRGHEKACRLMGYWGEKGIRHALTRLGNVRTWLVVVVREGEQ